MRLPRIAMPLAAAALLAGCNGDKDLTEVRVMTQNLWLGIELEPILGATSPAQVPGLVQAAWSRKLETEFTQRVGRIADAIQASQADLVGLQEVTQYFSGPSTLPPTPATSPEGDFLQILLAELAARGLSYSTASAGGVEGVVVNTNIQLPGTQGQDYRLVDSEAVLARAGIAIARVTKGNFAHDLVFQLAGSPVPFHLKRGWVAVDAVKDGKPFTFVSTHLEAFHPGVQGEQARELLALFPSSTPTVIVGDLNSDPRDAAWPSYGILVSSTTGFAEAGPESGAVTPTCCYDPASDPQAQPPRRVDLVLHSPHFETRAATLHVEPFDTAIGFWPSDHRGFSAVLGLE